MAFEIYSVSENYLPHSKMDVREKWVGVCVGGHLCKHLRIRKNRNTKIF